VVELLIGFILFLLKDVLKDTVNTSISLLKTTKGTLKDLVLA
jgi:hypothetical protein